MALTGKEMETFKRLQSKAAEPCLPLTEKDLSAMEENITENYNIMPEMMSEIMEPWNLFCGRLQILSNDNAKLIAEIRRLNSVPEVREPQRSQPDE